MSIPRLITNLKLLRDDSHVMHHPAIEEVIAKLVEMEGDARRYRWLRARFLETKLSTGISYYSAALAAFPLRGCNGEVTFDAAIDAASGERK